MIKNILYIGSQYEHSNKDKGDSLNKQAFYEIFLRTGYEVNPVWYDEDYSSLHNEIIQAASHFKPDMIFFVLQRDQISKKTLRELQENGYFMVNFFGDDQWRFEDYSRHYANFFNVCITTDKYSVNKYKAIGQKNIIRSQWASLECDTHFKDVNYKYDVSFVGGSGPYRKWFVKELFKKGIIVNCFGDGWENGRIEYTDMQNIFNFSKINLNISNSTQYDARYLISNPRNILNTIRSLKNVSQTKARIFEIPVFGGFELTEYVPSLEDYFDIGKEIACYKDVDEACLLINYYLQNSEERELIKTRGVERSRKDHTFKNRVSDFMRLIEVIYDKF
jgi:spore maturation protein CgeB